MGRLVLTMKQGESFTIGTDVTVEFVRCSGNRTVVRVLAPAHVAVQRQKAKHKLPLYGTAAEPPLDLLAEAGADGVD